MSLPASSNTHIRQLRQWPAILLVIAVSTLMCLFASPPRSHGAALHDRHRPSVCPDRLLCYACMVGPPSALHSHKQPGQRQQAAIGESRRRHTITAVRWVAAASYRESSV